MQRIESKIIFVLFVGILASFVIVSRPTKKNTLPNISSPQKIVQEQPGSIKIVQEKNPLLAQIRHGTPSAERGSQYAKWLQCSYQIKVGNTSGSGTLCYYDYKSKIGYIISCGHLWNGVFRKTGARSSEVATIVTWYHNNQKLPKPRSYYAEVIFYDSNYDVSLLSFKPDWVPEIYFPIAKVKQYSRGERMHSLGSDHGGEVAHYVVEIMGFGSDPRGGTSLVTQYNSPRPGRSGGGLIDSDNYYVGICWGTSRKDGSGIGYFVPLEVIHTAYKQHGCGFLIGAQLPGLARSLRIFDHNNPNTIVPREFILMPER